VLGNMVKNALEAIPKGEKVTLNCGAVDRGVELRVHNPGCIPPDVQSQIFKWSFSTKGKNRGLGTYGMRLLSERYLGGKVAFTSTPESGTTFTATFPLTLKK
jgi:signal transduction histidine kinase